jgi:hypothetical protein
MMNDRRQHPRIETALDVRWDGISGSHQAKISNISINGCFIETAGQARTGELISFTIPLPTGSTLMLKGRVMYQRPSQGFGVLFEPLSELQHEQLSMMVDLALPATEQMEAAYEPARPVS